MSVIKSRRSRIYLGGMLQGTLVKRLAIGWAVYNLLLFHGLFAVAYIEGTRVPADDDAQPTFLQSYKSFAWQNRLLIFGACAAGPIFLWDVVRCTHRVAGPLVRLENTLLRMAKGETVQEIKFRKGDWLTSLERALNIYLASRAAATQQVAPPTAEAEFAPAPLVPDARVVAQGDHDLNDLLRELRDINETLAALNMSHAETLGESGGFMHFGQDRPPRF
ncbi:MAG TPA: hypothetical protein VGP76_00325 [Planctomycetaceae bacterium]|jgi:hypothetical protein|nr:hypothetical protein [Planctomycetaceae bacterium]